MQKGTRKKRVTKRVSSAEAYINIRLYKIRDYQSYMNSLQTYQQIETHGLMLYATSGPHKNMREVSFRSSLTPGAYLVLPSTWEEDREEEFMVRIFTEKPMSDAENCKQLKAEAKIVGSSKVTETLYVFS